jgi:hypothetical protein
MGREIGKQDSITWIKDYEVRRTSGESEMSQLLQIRPDLRGLSWNEIRELETDLVDQDGKVMNIGQSFQALKRSWHSFKLNRKYGSPAPELALRILKLQAGLGLPLSDFEQELEGYGGMAWALQELENESSSDEDEETILLREEKQAMFESLGVDGDSNESEWSEWSEGDDLNGAELSKQLRKEEFQDQLNVWGLDDGKEWQFHKN